MALYNHLGNLRACELLHDATGASSSPRKRLGNGYVGKSIPFRARETVSHVLSNLTSSENWFSSTPNIMYRDTDLVALDPSPFAVRACWK